TNRYFMRAESFRVYERWGGQMTAIFPAGRWEYLIAEAQVLGVRENGGLERATFPPSPGHKVLETEVGGLNEFLGLSPNGGVELGKLKHHELPVKIDLTRLLRKHVAVLAKSGSGKSHFTSVVVEELMERPKELGRPAIVIMDVHGEYLGLAESYPSRVKIVHGEDMRIGVPNLGAYQLLEFTPEMSGMQVRELQRVIGQLKAEMLSGKGPFGLEEIMSRIESDDDINKNIRQALLGWLQELQSLGIFDHSDQPGWESTAEPGKVVVVDFSGMTSLRKKQMLVAYAARRLFNARKRGRVPPFVLCLEEAHQFCPSGDSKASAISRSVIETIAREGRKFYSSLMLISQRPVRLSTTVLSQANTNIILRVTNPYDLEHIKQSSEAITSEVAGMISSLPVGEALVVGEAVNHPIFVKVRRRKSRESGHGACFEDAAREFERKSGRESSDAKAFM
ncbi:MAG: ATP-binding protein, partial [Candidatus Hadarchaeota archaeon]